MTEEVSAPPLMVAPFRLDTLHEPPPPAPPPRERGRHALPTHRRRHRWRRWVLVGAVVLVLAAGAFVGVRLHAPDPAPSLTAAFRSRPIVVPARPVNLPWPATGQAALSIPALGVHTVSGPEHPVPVASLTKLVTAYVILHDHPLAPGETGPTVVVTPTDVTDYFFDIVGDDTNAPVAAGEQLTEQQLLAGMLVHSADNYADMLARWDAGSVPAFVDRMNAAAQQIGMSQSHFTDPSGIDPGSQSTASDLLEVTQLDMADPVFAAMVKATSVTLPVAGTVPGYTPLLGVSGVVGVKSGVTSQAGGCDVLAAVRTVHGRSVMFLTAVTGQTGSRVLDQAGLHGLALVNAADQLVGSADVLTPGRVVAHVSEGGSSADARAVAPVSFLTWPGQRGRVVFRPVRHLTDWARRGERVGTVVATFNGHRVVVPVRLAQDVPRPSLLQRILSATVA